MDTQVEIRVESPDSPALAEAVDQAIGWFGEVERRCSRFDAASELVRLSASAGSAVPVSPMLFEALRLALMVADLTDGAFDPTVGAAMAHRGFDHHYQTNARVSAPAGAERATYRDVHLDEQASTVTLARPAVLDVGALAKGLAVDLAATSLAAFPSFLVSAGGDVRVRGHGPRGEPWAVGLRHPRANGGLLGTVRLTDGAVCSSGDYERPAPGTPGEHHLLDARTGRSSHQIIAASVVAPTALIADALATAACLRDAAAGLALLGACGVAGLLVDNALGLHATQELQGLLPC